MIAPVRFALVLAAGHLLTAGAWAQGVEPRTIVLGQSAPLSGPERAIGEDVRNGALALLRRLNDAGGIAGRRIELATLDDAGEPGRALANTRRFIEEFGVFALFGYPDASLTREVLGLVLKAQVPLIAPVSGADADRQPGHRVFAVRASYSEELERIVGYYAQLGLSRFALVRNADAGGARLYSGARRALARRDLPAPSEVPVGPTGIASAARSALAAGVDVIILAVPQAPAAELVRALRRGGSGAQIVATSMADAVALARALGADGAGVTLSQVVPPLEQESLPVVAEYRSALEAETGRQSYSAASLEAFIGAKVLAEAVRRAGRALSRESLTRALEGMSSYDAGGYVVSYSPTSRQGSSRIYLQAIGRDGLLLH